MNPTEEFLVNCGPNDHADWRLAHWDRTADLPRFHWMVLDGTGQRVLLHDSCIKPVKTDTKPLEDEIRRLLEHAGLAPEARKLITAALQAQSTAGQNFTI